MASRRYRAGLAWRILRDRRTLHVPPGHHYSPLPSAGDVERAVRRAAMGEDARDLPGIDLRRGEQVSLLSELVAYYPDLPFTETGGACRFHYDNDWFMYADAVLYALLLRHLRPRRVVEVGAGWSSVLALDVAELFLGDFVRLTFVDPDASRLRSIARPGDLAGRLLECPVQDAPAGLFDELGAGDVLMVDSSHVLKAGSDVQYLLDDVLPRLAPGVVVHLHDVFYPFEYPPAWLRSGTGLNEAYAVRLMLQFSRAYEVMLFTDYLQRYEADWLRAHLPLMLAGRHVTGGIWLRRTSAG